MKNPIVLRIPYFIPRIEIRLGSWNVIRHLILCHVFGAHEYVETQLYKLDKINAIQETCIHCLRKKHRIERTISYGRI